VASFRSVAAVGKSLEALLTARFTLQQPVDGMVATAQLIQTNRLDELNEAPNGPLVTLLLYRVDFNKAMRATWSGVGSLDGRAHLPVDLHYLLTAWADNAEHEHLLIGRSMQILDEVGSLSGPLLQEMEPGDWEHGETVQLSLEDVATDDLMRTFESLTCDFRLSIPYIARIAVITSPEGTPLPDVLTHIQGTRPVLAGQGAGGRP
jgi:hypothetical protein